MARILIPLLALLCLAPFVSSAAGLFLGVAVALFLGNPYLAQTRKITHTLLSAAVVGMGAGMNLHVITAVGLQGLGYTVVGLALSLTAGFFLGKILKTDQDTSILITVGTAICGGSAIAAVAPVLRAKHQHVSVALGTVFVLNATALLLFPFLGHLLHLSQHQFGLWSALAIHDTSSVVGASMQYGAEALQVGTTVKLARALWIIPVAFGIGFWQAKKVSSQEKAQTKKPWFILGFVAMAALVTWLPELQTAGSWVNTAAKRLLVVTLFLIGASLTRETLRSVGIKPFLQGVFLWILVAGGTLTAIHWGWIH